MQTEHKKTEFKKLVDKLISLGENKDELEVWQELFGALNDQEQEKITSNLRKELDSLSRLN